MSRLPMIRLISTDFDGTLVNYAAQPPVAPDFLDLLAQMRREGTVWAVNTGRTVQHIDEGLAVFGFPFGPDYIVTSERHVFRPVRGGAGWEDYGDWNVKCDLAHEELFVGAREVFDEVVRFVETATQAKVIYEEGRPVGLIATSEEEMDRIAIFIGQARARHPTFDFQRNTMYVRFCHTEYSKGAALGELGRLLGIPREEIFAAGDHYNDIPMLDGRFARCNACPANAAEPVKEVVTRTGGYVAAAEFSEGVAEALRFYVNAPV
jgi:HAD superfamily hydrolase (TIGR01484 family)